MRIKPEYLPTAIEIGSNSLKLLQLAKFKSTYKVVKADYVSLGRDRGSAGSLEKLVKDNQIKGEVAASIPLNKANAYTYILPDMPADEIEPAIIWKIKQNLPPGLGFDDISFDYTCSNPQGNGNKELCALVFVVSKQMASDMVKLFKDLSLDLVSIEPKPYAVIESLFSFKNISELETVLVLQLGASDSSIIIVSGGHPYLVMPLTATGNGFTGTLVNYYQLDWAKAEEFKIREGLGNLQLNEAQSVSGPGCFPALSSQLENLIIDIEHTFKYFSNQLIKSRAPALERLVLCGGSAVLKNLDKFLADKLKVPVDIFDPVDFFVSHSEHEASPAIISHSSAFTGVLGLASRFTNGGFKV